MVVSVGVTVFVNLPLGSLVQRGVRCIRVGESAIQVGVTLATSDPVVGDANINDLIESVSRLLIHHLHQSDHVSFADPAGCSA